MVKVFLLFFPMMLRGVFISVRVVSTVSFNACAAWRGIFISSSPLT
jgi:hypothetical protein